MKRELLRNKIVGWMSFVRLLLIVSLVISLLPAVPSTVSAVPQEVVYLDEHGVTQTQDQVVTVIDQGNYLSPFVLNDGWYLFRDSWNQDSTITVSGAVHIILEDGSDVTVAGSPNEAGINVANGGNLTIYAQSTGDNMGKLHSTGGFGGAGIGGGDRGAGGTITINGGDITATGGHWGAGIGGGYFGGAGGTITINGGDITATGAYYGAGIGSGSYGAGGMITINGGEITATGGELGAGIGVGAFGSGGTITINGGEITATGGERGAGIGGDSLGAGVTIIVNGTNTLCYGINTFITSNIPFYCPYSFLY
jgi:hypothetical protein